MKVLLTGANGYIGKRLLQQLVHEGHEVWCCVREPHRFSVNASMRPKIHVLQIDFLAPGEVSFPKDIDAAYYLIHSMTSTKSDFQKLEEESARNFVRLADASGVKQIIYLGGLVSDVVLSAHLKSRQAVGNILRNAKAKHTILQAGIIVGSGSASFEIIRDLVEKLPIMITPKWLNTKCQPIGIRNVLQYLTGVLGEERCYNQTFDIGGPDILTYKEMLLQFAEARKLKRYIGIVPVMTPKLSSYWLYFVTSTSYNLAVNLVNSMKIDVICKENRIRDIIPIETISYRGAVEMAFAKIEQNAIISSWKDAYNYRGQFDPQEFLQVPEFGVFADKKQMSIVPERKEQVVRNIFAIGGDRGWYYANWLWRMRGRLDKLVGGIGLRRGRTSLTNINPGDALDFWRVIAADQNRMRLLLFAEMKLPGDAWLEFKLKEEQGALILYQTATFRPHGLWGRVYWYSVLPFHFFIFGGMIKGIVNYNTREN
jgi:uncharacterized protein YbjT (DUF2867 family)